MTQKIARHVKNRLNYDPGIETLTNSEGIVASDPVEKAEVLAKQFASVFTRDDGTLPTCEDMGVINLRECEFDPFIVYRYLSSLPSKSSITPDSVPQFFLKKCAVSLALPLSLIFKASFHSSYVPKIWRQAIVRPLFKKGNRSIASNYRPVSLTSAVCRVMEKIVVFNMQIYLQTNKLISEHQYGFVRKRSCMIQLLLTLNDWYQAFEEGKFIDCIYVDFCKAFDSVSFPKLLIKLKSFGIEGKLLSWIDSFLHQRTQRVLVDGVLSAPYEVLSGVPQGSILGPLLFNLYVNDIPSFLPNDVCIKLYADDLKIYASTPVKIQEALIRLEHWSKIWQLPISEEKTFVLHLGQSNPRSPYSLSGKNLEPCSEVRDLGILIDDKLKYEKHIAKITRAAYMRCNHILKVFRSKKVATYAAAYRTYVRPILEYATEIFNPISVKMARLMEKPQRFFTRVALKRCGYHQLSYGDRLRIFGIETLELRRCKRDLITLFKISEGVYNISVQDLLPSLSTRPSRTHHRKFFQRRFSNVSRGWFINRVVPIWNTLPAALDQCSVNSFSNLLSKIDPLLLVKNPKVSTE